MNNSLVAAHIPAKPIPSEIDSSGSTKPVFCATVSLRTSTQRNVCPQIEIGRVLRDRYVIEQQLGSGGMGVVFKALDLYRTDLPEAQRYVAIKFLNDSGDARPEQLANLKREFYCTQALSHRNVVKVHEIDRDGDLHFFTMEYLEGELLSEVVDRLNGAPMPRAYAWHIVREIGAGLAHAHARHVVHGDLKPHNIMVTRSGEIRLLDFGSSSACRVQDLAEAVRRGGTRSALTPAYASCELLAGRPADPRDDLYAFACLTYELIAGAHPFQRRPATVARDLGIVARRPFGLCRRQWKAIELGLSWHRGARSMPIRVWLERLNIERPTMPLPGLDLRAEPRKERSGTAFVRAAALCAAILLTVSFVVELTRWTAQPAAAVARSAPVRAVESTAPAESGPRVDPQPAVAIQASEPASQPADNKLARPRAALNPLVVTPVNHRVRTGENFAEIRVHRTSVSPSDSSFVWWTEAASAQPGVDYVDQEKAMQSFPRGGQWTSFFVKLVPREIRTQPEMFYIVVAKPGHDAAPVPIARTAVWLPVNHGDSWGTLSAGASPRTSASLP